MVDVNDRNKLIQPDKIFSFFSFHYPESVKRSDDQISLATGVVCHFTCTLPGKRKGSLWPWLCPIAQNCPLTALRPHMVMEVGAGVVPVLSGNSLELRTEECGRVVFSAPTAIDR